MLQRQAVPEKQHSLSPHTPCGQGQGRWLLSHTFPEGGTLDGHHFSISQGALTRRDTLPPLTSILLAKTELLDTPETKARGLLVLLCA